MKRIAMVISAVLLGSVLSAAPAVAASDALTISGRILDSNGQPVAGVPISVSSGVGSDGEDPEFEDDDVSDSSGRYSVRSSPNFWALLSVHELKKWIDVDQDWFPTAGQTEIVRDVVVARPAAITGKVTDAGGAALTNATVFARVVGDTVGTTQRTLSTKSDGTFAFASLRPSEYQLRYFKDGYIQSTRNVTVAEGKKSTGNSAALDKQAKLTGKVYVNNVLAQGDLGLVAVKLYDAAGGIVWAEGANTGTFKIYNLAAGDYRLEFCPASPSDFIECSSRSVTLATGQQLSGQKIKLTSRPGAQLTSFVDGTIAPNTVTWGKTVTVTGKMRSYGDTSTGKIQLLHHGKTVNSRTVGSDGKVAFTLDSDEWGNKKGTHRYKTKLTFTGSTGVKKAVDYPTFRIR